MHRLPPITALRILTKNYTHLVYDRPCKLNGLLQSFRVPKIKVFILIKQGNKNPGVNKNQTQTFEKSCWSLLRPLELLIIPPSQPSNPIIR
jgi:hypothetical protein